jgi:glucose/arabinose dehydrogenase
MSRVSDFVGTAREVRFPLRRTGAKNFAQPSRSFAVLLLIPLRIFAASSEQGYTTSGDCDGFPGVALTVSQPFCVGLVASKLGFARGVAAIGHDIFVVDMGGWDSHRGRLLRLPNGGHGAPEVVLRGLYQPNGLTPGPNHTLYVGITGKIAQVDPYATNPAKTMRVVVTGLPTTGRHPLATMAVAQDGVMYINVGSATDNCERFKGVPGGSPTPCPETLEAPPRGSILSAPRSGESRDARELTVYARGLRNSMAMAVLPDRRLVAAVNARDSIDCVSPSLSDEELPHDTLDLIEPGADYGWPYCFDNDRSSPEYPSFDCRERTSPTMLLPAHAAPLGMLVYQGKRLPGLGGKLIIGYHGYRSTGHRIVSVDVNSQSMPAGRPAELVGDWGYKAGSHPQGAPVSLFEMEDGSILITEDHNGTLLRLSINDSK